MINISDLKQGTLGSFFFPCTTFLLLVKVHLLHLVSFCKVLMETTFRHEQLALRLVWVPTSKGEVGGGK